MKVLVPVKRVIDYNVKPRVKMDGTGVDLANVKMSMNPFDEIAVEEALRLREAGKASEVVLVSIGSAGAADTIRSGLAMGADRGILVRTDERTEPLGVAKAIAAVAREGKYDFVWFGQKGVGYDESLVGPMVAELLDLPHVGSVIKLEVAPGKVTAHREIEGAHEIVESTLPVVLTAQKGLNEPRYASLKGIMGAKKKPIAEKKLAELGIPETDPAGAKTRWRKLELPPPRQACKLIPADDPAAAAKELVRLLREEAKVL